MSAQGEKGMVLVQVLGIVAFASAIAVIMTTIQDRAIGSATRLSEKSQASALARSAEASIVTAFRQDGRTSPEVDHPGEEWVIRGQRPLQLGAATLSIEVQDAQARYNINRMRSGLSEIAVFRRVAAAAGLAPDSAEAVIFAVTEQDSIDDLSDLAAEGIRADELSRLSNFATALPIIADTNINTAHPELVRAIFGNPSASARLLSLRQRKGFISRSDLGEANVLLPSGTGLQTDFADVSVSVTFGEATVVSTCRIERTIKNDEDVSAAIISRKIR